MPCEGNVLDAKYSHWNVLNLAINYKYRVTLLYAENMYCTLLNIYNNLSRNHYIPKQLSQLTRESIPVGCLPPTFVVLVRGRLYPPWILYPPIPYPS